MSWDEFAKTNWSDFPTSWFLKTGYIKILACLCALFFLTGCGNNTMDSYHSETSCPTSDIYEIAAQPNNYESYATHSPALAPKLPILHLTHAEFLHSIDNPRIFPTLQPGQIYAGVVPHHNIAATLISGFFSQAANSPYEYDLVIILGPNHEGTLANVITSYRHWDIGDGVFTNGNFVHSATQEINAAISHRHMELEHSISILIPYIYHYLPGTEVAPLMLNRSLSFGETEDIFHWLNSWVINSGKNVLLVASIDFSHFLPVNIARERDEITKSAILSHNLHELHNMNYHHLDSPAAMIIFLMYLAERGIEPKIVAHTDAYEFLPGLDETTSYMIIVGAQESGSTVQLTFAGDIMLHQAQANAAFNPATGEYCFNHSFAAIRPFLQGADLTIGNLETVLAGHFMDFGLTLGGSQFTNCENTLARYLGLPLFSAPDEFGHALRYAGFDLLSTANNHSLDQGVEGLLRTINFLEEIGINNFGTYRTKQERDTILVSEVNGIRFAFLSYTFGTNQQPLPPGQEYLVNIISESLLRSDIARAREIADFVIVMPHIGYEYEPIVRPSVKNWAMTMLSAGADIVIAGHPHVVQPMGFVDVVDHQTGETRQGFVAYCLGNFISSQRIPPTDAGVLLNLYFEQVGDAVPVFVGVSYVPTWVKFADRYGNTNIQILPIAETLKKIDAGENLGLRQVDIARMQEAYLEIVEVLRFPN